MPVSRHIAARPDGDVTAASRRHTAHNDDFIEFDVEIST